MYFNDLEHANINNTCLSLNNLITKLFNTNRKITTMRFIKQDLYKEVSRALARAIHQKL